jgi:hypothetical protein
MKIAQNIFIVSSVFPRSLSQHSQMMCRFSLFAAQNSDRRPHGYAVGGSCVGKLRSYVVKCHRGEKSSESLGKTAMAYSLLPCYNSKRCVLTADCCKKGEWTMEQLFLMPGQERCERFKDANGAPRVHYSYCSMRGAFFDCESRSLEEAQRLCEDWLVGQDRCYRN